MEYIVIGKLVVLGFSIIYVVLKIVVMLMDRNRRAEDQHHKDKP